MHHTQIEKPAWTAAERITDITDIWIEECDPQNEDGAVALAYFSKDSDGVLAIEGISVQEDALTIFYSRERAIKFIGLDAIWRAEAHEMETASFE